MPFGRLVGLDPGQESRDAPGCCHTMRNSVNHAIASVVLMLSFATPVNAKRNTRRGRTVVTSKFIVLMARSMF